MPIKNQINRQASGFLDLFRAKVGGQGPRVVEENVQPVVEVGPYLKAELLKTDIAQSSGASPPTNLNISVPDGELWSVVSILGQLGTDTTMPADHIAIWNLQIQGLTNSAGAVVDANVGTVSMDNRGAGATMPAIGSVLWQPGYPVLLPSNVNVQLQLVQDNTASNYNAYLSVTYHVLET